MLRRRVAGHNIHIRANGYDHYDMVIKGATSGLSPFIAIDRKAGGPLHK
jgi:hypothetical protein